MDFDLYSPIGDDRPLIRIADKTGFQIAALDVIGSIGWFLLGSAPMLIVIAFAVL